MKFRSHRIDDGPESDPNYRPDLFADPDFVRDEAEVSDD